MSRSGDVSVEYAWTRYDEDDNEITTILTIAADVDYERGDRDCPGGYEIDLISAIDEKTGEDHLGDIDGDASVYEAIIAQCSDPSYGYDEDCDRDR